MGFSCTVFKVINSEANDRIWSSAEKAFQQERTWGECFRLISSSQEKKKCLSHSETVIVKEANNLSEKPSVEQKQNINVKSNRISPEMLLTALCPAAFSVRMPGIVPGCCRAGVRRGQGCPTTGHDWDQQPWESALVSTWGRKDKMLPGYKDRCWMISCLCLHHKLSSSWSSCFLPLCLLSWGVSEQLDGRFGQSWPNLEKTESSSVQIQKYTQHGGKPLKQMNNVCKRTKRWKVQSVKGLYYTLKKNDI